jgi:hypothetical protein
MTHISPVAPAANKALARSTPALRTLQVPVDSYPKRLLGAAAVGAGVGAGAAAMIFALVGAIAKNLIGEMGRKLPTWFPKMPPTVTPPDGVIPFDQFASIFGKLPLVG